MKSLLAVSLLEAEAEASPCSSSDLITEWQHCQGKGEGLLGDLMLTPEPGSIARSWSFLFQNIFFLFLVKSCRTPEMTTTALPLAQELVALGNTRKLVWFASSFLTDAHWLSHLCISFFYC